jgi:hypothetical protein
MDACGVLIIIVIGAVVAVGAIALGLYLHNRNQVNKQLQLAFSNYRQSLELLKQQPNNSDLHQSALEWGRYYSNLTRNQEGVTLYDEVALANDLKAASAGGGPPARNSTAAVAQSIEQRLDRLKALFNSGNISEQEYRERRDKLLDEV